MLVKVCGPDAHCCDRKIIGPAREHKLADRLSADLRQDKMTHCGTLPATLAPGFSAVYDHSHLLPPGSKTRSRNKGCLGVDGWGIGDRFGNQGESSLHFPKISRESELDSRRSTKEDHSHMP